jgi:hypothetical protein
MEVALTEQLFGDRLVSVVETPVCGDCRFAQIFALQPRTICVHPWAPQRGSVLPTAQPACSHLSLREKETVALHAWTPR